MRWDKKKGKYINSKSTDKKYIISENGTKIPASFRSGKFDEWRKQRNLKPTSTVEDDSNKRFKHKQQRAPKLPDKFRDDYHKQKKKVEKAIESGVNVKGFHTLNKKSNLLNRLERLDCLKKRES